MKGLSDIRAILLAIWMLILINTDITTVTTSVVHILLLFSSVVLGAGAGGVACRLFVKELTDTP